MPPWSRRAISSSFPWVGADVFGVTRSVYLGYAKRAFNSAETGVRHHLKSMFGSEMTVRFIRNAQLALAQLHVRMGVAPHNTFPDRSGSLGRT